MRVAARFLAAAYASQLAAMLPFEVLTHGVGGVAYRVYGLPQLFWRHAEDLRPVRDFALSIEDDAIAVGALQLHEDVYHIDCSSRHLELFVRRLKSEGAPLAPLRQSS
jgi:hypothetical protein